MLRGIASVLVILVLLTGCGPKHLAPVSAIGVSTSAEIKYWIDPSTPQTLPPIALAANRTGNVKLPDIPYIAKLKLQARSFDASNSELKEYVAIIGPSARVQVTPQNWLQVDSGWAYVNTPHAASSISLLWNPSHYPWVATGCVRAGVRGFTAADHLIVTNSGGSNPAWVAYFGATGSAPENSIGQLSTYLGSGDWSEPVDVTAASEYVVGTASSYSTGSYTSNPEALAQAAVYRSIAEYFLTLP